VVINFSGVSQLVRNSTRKSMQLFYLLPAEETSMTIKTQLICLPDCDPVIPRVITFTKLTPKSTLTSVHNLLQLFLLFYLVFRIHNNGN